MQLNDWPHVEVALLLIGRTHNSFVKTGFEEINRLLDYQLCRTHGVLMYKFHSFFANKFYIICID
jgi:hypothetical protein